MWKVNPIHILFNFFTDYITTYLESTFYNLAVIALHDCETYRRMAILAELRYGLKLAELKLPIRSVDQGCFDFLI